MSTLDSTEQSLLAAIAANPEDVDARTVYADWLDSQGDVRGEYLRLEMLLRSGPARMAALTAQLDPEWLAKVTYQFAVMLMSVGSNKIDVIKYVRQVNDQSLGLRDALDLVDDVAKGNSRRVCTKLTITQAQNLVTDFARWGAKADIMPYVHEPKFDKR